jgi:2-phosphosulfolactate phosphatase
MRVTVELAPPAPRNAGRPGPEPAASRASDRGAAVMIDVLRSTTTLTVALDRGARAVVALADPAEALALRARDPDVLACGEREGRAVPGFDLGNSPFEYQAERVAGRTLAFASTNGSPALRALEGYAARFLAAFVNASAVVEALAGRAVVHILCAGKLGRFALEDAACAGWLCQRLADRGAALEGEGARLCRALAPRDAAEVRALVQGCSHGRYLRALGAGFARDVEFCGALDALPRAFAI